MLTLGGGGASDRGSQVRILPGALHEIPAHRRFPVGRRGAATGPGCRAGNADDNTSPKRVVPPDGALRSPTEELQPRFDALSAAQGQPGGFVRPGPKRRDRRAEVGGHRGAAGRAGTSPGIETMPLTPQAANPFGGTGMEFRCSTLTAASA
jgi:hypothetical protein